MAGHGLKSERGFTLTELMVVVVVLAITIAVGFPSYQEQVRKARRADGLSSLGKASMVMESCRSDLATYTGCNARLAATSEEGYYNLGVTITGGGTAYTLTATAAGVQASDTKCTTLTLTSQGTRGYSGSAADANACWRG